MYNIFTYVYIVYMFILNCNIAFFFSEFYLELFLTNGVI